MAGCMSFVNATAPLLRSNTPFTARARHQRCIRPHASADRDVAEAPARRELLLHSVNAAMLASLFTFGGVERPSSLGIQDYGEVDGKRIQQLGLCPKSPNCISTSEAANSRNAVGGADHYVPPWTYNPEEGRGKSISRTEAIDQLVETVSNIRPDNFEPTLINQTDDYVYFEFQSPTFGFIDDVEFFFPDDSKSQVEYRSASRIGESDNDINRKRIRAIRQELQKKGWKSVGF